MPYKLIKHTDGSYAVKNLDSGKIIAKRTTLPKAQSQIRLLNAIEKGFKFK
jgi:hypothetical protein